MVEFKTRYDAKTLGKLTEVQLKNSGRLTKGFVWIFIIMGVIMLLFAYDEYTSGESYYFSLGFSIFSISFGMFFPSFIKGAMKKVVPFLFVFGVVEGTGCEILLIFS